MTYDYWAGLPELPNRNHWKERDNCTRDVKLGLKKDDAKRSAQGLQLLEYPCADGLAYESPGADIPPLPFALGFTFHWSLSTPFFSRSDSNFDVFDNPLCRDRLTGRPVLRASGAKGMLRHAGRDFQLVETSLWNQVMGVANEFDQGGFAGRLVVGDVLFEGASKADVLAPHDREWGVVRHPVFFETVPTGATATWGLMLYQYVHGEFDLASAAAAILSSANFLITELGMSAKRNVGYGLGRDLTVTLRPGAALDLGMEGREAETLRPFPKAIPPAPNSSSDEAPDWGKAYLEKDGSLCSEAKAVERKARAICAANKQNSDKQIQIQMKKLNEKNTRVEWQRTKSYLESQTEENVEARRAAIAIRETLLAEEKAWYADPANLRVLWKFDDLARAVAVVESLKVNGGTR